MNDQQRYLLFRNCNTGMWLFLIFSFAWYRVVYNQWRASGNLSPGEMKCGDCVERSLLKYLMQFSLLLSFSLVNSNSLRPFEMIWKECYELPRKRNLQLPTSRISHNFGKSPEVCAPYLQNVSTSKYSEFVSTLMVHCENANSGIRILAPPCYLYYCLLKSTVNPKTTSH